MIHSNSNVETQKTNKNCIQIVATTATLQNKNEIAKFLNAVSYERDFRPVELKEYVKVDKAIYEVDRKNMNKIDNDQDSFLKYNRSIELEGYTAEMKKDDPDGLIKLVKEVVPDQSCLIFCSTKKNCENVAQLLSKYLIDELKSHKRDLKLRLFQDLKEENGNNVCPILRQSLQCGIAYHHSGLTAEERQLIEQAYREGVLCIITCTSTLAAGVNLPAKRVIIRSPYVAQAFISTNSYKQMIGRAGRAGLIDSAGESILLYQNKDKNNVFSLLTEPMKRCESSFECDDKKAIRLLVLSLIGLNMAHYGSQILLFFKETLFYLQNKEKLKEKKDDQNVIISSDTIKDTKELFVPDEFYLISNALAYLFKEELITIKNDEIPENLSSDSSSLKKFYYSQFEITKLGMASIKGNINLDYVHKLYEDLKLGLKSIVLSNCLHLLYLCTPYDLVNSMYDMNYDTYARKVMDCCFYFDK
jgi:POLQ-like helicase